MELKEITITKKQIILKGYTTFKGYCKTKYVVYKDEDGIYLAANQPKFRKEDGNIIVYNTYTRKLAENSEEFRKLSIDEIEKCAYLRYMDGAR